jgi:hypothetical protein
MYIHISATYKASSPRLLLSITCLTLNVATELSFSDVNVCHKTSFWLRPAASYVSGTHSSPSRSSNRRHFWRLLSCRCMFPTDIQRSSPLFWCTAHYVCSRHRRFHQLENSNTDCLCDEVICGLIPGRGKRFFLVFKTLRPALGRTLPSIQCVPVDFFRQVKRPERETDNLPTASLPLTPLWHP